MGYDEADVYTALSLEAQSHIPALVFLKDRSSGKSWHDIANTRAAGQPLSLPGQRVFDTPAIDESAIAAFVAQGFSRLDILSAASMARRYGKKTEELLAMKQTDDSWGEVESKVIQETRPGPRPDGRPDFRFGPDQSEKTRGGLGRNEILALMDQGFTVDEILDADDMAVELGIDAGDVLTRKAASGKGLREIYHQIRSEQGFEPPGGIDLGKTLGIPREEVARLRSTGHSDMDLLRASRLAKESSKSIDDVLSGFEAAGRNWEALPQNEPGPAGTARTLGLSEEQVKAYLAKGYTTRELVRAHALGQRNGKPLDDVLSALTAAGDDWSALAAGEPRQVTHLDRLTQIGPDGAEVDVAETASGLSLEEVNKLLLTYAWTDIHTADQLAAKWKTDAVGLLRQRDEGHSWSDIISEFRSGQPADRLPAVLVALGADESVTAELMLPRAEFDALRASGRSEDEIMIAAVIANVLGRNTAEVVELRKTGLSWVAVVEALQPDASEGGN